MLFKSGSVDLPKYQKAPYLSKNKNKPQNNPPVFYTFKNTSYLTSHLPQGRYEWRAERRRQYQPDWKSLHRETGKVMCFPSPQIEAIMFIWNGCNIKKMAKDKSFIITQTCFSASSPHLSHGHPYVLKCSSQRSGRGSQHSLLLYLTGSIYHPKLLI